MLANEHLYGVDVDAPEVPQEIIDERLGLLKTHLAKLLDYSFHTRDGNRCNDVLKAIGFWENINKKDK